MDNRLLTLTRLGRLYVEHPEFRAYYDRTAPGLAEYLSRAIESYCGDFPE